MGDRGGCSYLPGDRTSSCGRWDNELQPALSAELDVIDIDVDGADPSGFRLRYPDVVQQ